MLRSETSADPDRMARALRGLRAYQEAERVTPPLAMPVIAEAHGAHMRDYGGDGTPVLFIPSLINPPNILDLSTERSLLRWLASRNHRILLLDWGTDSLRRRDMSVAAQVEEIIVPMLQVPEELPAIAGYCLGGTMAAAAAAIAPVRGLATFAAPWHFSGYSGDTRATLLALWSAAKDTAATMGVLPMEVLQCAFWNLDPGRTISKFEAFAEMAPGSGEACGFVTLEDWANDGPPIPVEAARDIFEGFFRDDITGKGRWQVAGRIIDPSALTCPQFHAVSRTDHIVPEAAGFKDGTRLAVDRGHVGMVVGSHARTALWEPLDGWLSQLRRDC